MDCIVFVIVLHRDCHLASMWMVKMSVRTNNCGTDAMRAWCTFSFNHFPKNTKTNGLYYHIWENVWYAVLSTHKETGSIIIYLFFFITRLNHCQPSASTIISLLLLILFAYKHHYKGMDLIWFFHSFRKLNRIRFKSFHLEIIDFFFCFLWILINIRILKCLR